MPRRLHLQSLTFPSLLIQKSIISHLHFHLLLRGFSCSAPQQWRFSVVLIWALSLSPLIYSTNSLVFTLALLNSSLLRLLPIEILFSASSNPSQVPPPPILIGIPINPPPFPPPVLFSEIPPTMPDPLGCVFVVFMFVTCNCLM